MSAYARFAWYVCYHCSEYILLGPMNADNIRFIGVSHFDEERELNFIYSEFFEHHTILFKKLNYRIFGVAFIT